MIIKILPVKTHGGINRVIDYVASDKQKIADYRNQGIFHNLQSSDLKHIKREFHENYERFAKKRSNGNKAVHVILSVSPLDKEKMSLEKMDSIVRTYLEKAYPNALAFSTHHCHEQHYHSHAIVSPNAVMSDKSTRLSKSDLHRIHTEMLAYVREHHSDLETNIDEKNWGRKLHSEKAYYQEKRHPDLKMTKEVLSEKIQDIFRQSESSTHFYQQLEKMGFTTYDYKERVQGVYFGEENKKMRFSRLGLEYEKIEDLDVQNERLNELETIRSGKDEDRHERDLIDTEYDREPDNNPEEEYEVER